MEAHGRLALEDISPEFAHDSAVSALASVIASRQTALVKRSGVQPLSKESCSYYVNRVERLIRRCHFSETEVAADAITHVVEVMDEYDIDGFVQLPEAFNDIWPQLPDEVRSLSTPAAYTPQLTAAEEQDQ